MIKYNNSNINDWNFGDDNIIKVYRNNAVCYYKIDTSSPSGQTPCFAVVDDISQYSDTEFEDVFNKADGKWYKLNNLNQYEQYGVYGSGRTITHYDGKLTIDGDYEYQYSGGSWVSVGEVSGSSRVPQGYTEVEYLESPKKAEYPYINTNFAPNQNTRVIADFQYTQTNTHPRCFGCGPWNGLAYELNAENGVGTTSGVWNWKFGNTSGWLTTGVHTDFNRHTAEINNGKLYLDNTQIGSTSVTTFQLTDKIGLFGFIQSGTLGGTSAGEYMTGRFYSFKIYDNGTLVRDLVPCKNSSNVYGMYDIVGDSFYNSPNSYLFSGGSDVTQVDYPIYYDEMQDPPNNVSFSSMTEAEAYECPWVGMNATIDGVRYVFSGDSQSGYEWVLKPSRLPQGYTEVEYIERNSTHNGYLPLGEYFTENTVINIDFQMTQAKGNAIIGDYGSNNDNDDWRVFLNYDVTVNNWLVYDFINSRNYYNTGNWSKRFDLEIGNYYIKDLNTGTYLINSTRKTSFTRPNQMYLFHMEGSQGTNNIDYGYIYSVKIYQNNGLVRDFVPCIRDNDSMVGMYDLVNDVFYYPPNNGTLIAGDPV